MTVEAYLEVELRKFRDKYQDRELTQELKEEVAADIVALLTQCQQEFGNESPLEMWFQIKQNGDFLVFYEDAEITIH